MNMYNEMQNLIKYLKLALSRPDSDCEVARLLTGDVLKLVALLVTDRLLYPGEYGSKGKKLPTCQEILVRNQLLLKVFRAFFKDVNWDCLDGHQGQLILLLEEFTTKELLHIPGMVHEVFLSMTVSSNISKRKYQGSYYTPVHIVRYMVSNTLNYFTGIDNLERPKIIDPACGGGAFLLETWYALTEMGLSETAAAGCLFGTDIDGTAVSLSVYLLTVAVWAKSEKQMDLRVIKEDWEKRLITGNSLTGLEFFPQTAATENGQAEPGFDVVIGNPPYVSNKLILAEEKNYYQNHYSSAKGQFDLSVPFIELGLRLLKTGGVLSYITSNKFLAADYGKEIRRILLEYNRIYEIIDVSMLNSFANTAAYPVIITVGRNEPEETQTIKLSMAGDWQEVENQKAVSVEQKFFLNDRNYLISTRLDNTILPVIRRLEVFDKLIPQAKIKCGLAVTGFNKWIVRKPVSDKNLFSFIQAGDIQRYRVENPDYIEAGHFSQAKADEFTGVKLVVPGIATALKAAIDYSGSILGRVYYIKQDEITIDLNLLVVLLNSQVLNFYYNVKYWAVHLAGGYLRFNSGYLANLPVPDITGQPGAVQEAEKSVIAGEITELGRLLTDPQMFPELQETMECRAEALVFSLYGLNKADSEIIMQFNGLDAAKREKIIGIMKEVE